MIYVNCDSHQPALSKADYLILAGKRLGIGVEYLPSGLLEPEYVLNIEPYFQVKRGTKWTGIWEIDLLCDRPEANATTWAGVNDVFVAISSLPQRLEHAREMTTLLFQACDPVIHRRIPEIEPEFDFILCGTGGPERYQPRTDAINVLREKFSFSGFPNGQPTHDYVRTLNKARVQFIRSMSTHVDDGEIAQRFFECLAIGPVLTNYVPDLELTGLIEGLDYFSYKDHEEMVAKMTILIKNPEFREKMYMNARKKAVMYHSFDNRLVSILNRINETKSS